MNNAHINPMFQNIISNHVNLMQEYVDLLGKHDYDFEYSDDQKVWRKGRESLDKLRMMQRQIDTNFDVWNQFCDPRYKVIKKVA